MALDDGRIDPRVVDGYITRGADTQRTVYERTRTFDVEDFRIGGNGVRSDTAAMRAMIDRAMTLATNPAPSRAYSDMRFKGDLNITQSIMPDGFPVGGSLRGYGPGQSKLLISNAAASRVINTKGGHRCRIGGFGIDYAETITPNDYAIVLDACTLPHVGDIEVTRNYGTLKVGETGSVSRPLVENIIAASFRGGLGGDHVLVQWASNFNATRIRCNTAEEMTGAFYRFCPQPGMLIDTFDLIRCQGQNANHDDLLTGDGLVIDFSEGNVLSGTAYKCVFDHTFRYGIAIISRPYYVGGVLQKTSCREIELFHVRNTADAGVSRFIDHQGGGRFSQVGETKGYMQVALGAAVRIMPSAGYFEAPNYLGCKVRSTASILGEQEIPFVFDCGDDMRFQSGSVGKLGENDVTMPKLGRMTNGARVQFIGNEIDNVVDPTFDLTAAGAGSIINSNWGMTQVAS
jgi:hypothetical protein